MPRTFYLSHTNFAGADDGVAAPKKRPVTPCGYDL